MLLETKNLKLAQIRYFDTYHNGVEIPDIKAYTFLYKHGDHYINYLNPYEELPVYDRVPYTNTTMDGFDFGTKIVLAQGECMDGACYVIENMGVDNIFGMDTITSDQLEEFVLKSNLFFVDRLRLLSNKKVVSLDSKYSEDIEKTKKFKEYMRSSRKGAIYKK